MSTATLSQNTGFRAKIQHFGRFLSGMVMPNIGAFLAWGLITALFIPTGWTPNENLAKLVGPMIVYAARKFMYRAFQPSITSEMPMRSKHKSRRLT